MSTNWVKRTTGVKCPGGEISNKWANVQRRKVKTVKCPITPCGVQKLPRRSPLRCSSGINCIGADANISASALGTADVPATIESTATTCISTSALGEMETAEVPVTCQCR